MGFAELWYILPMPTLQHELRVTFTLILICISLFLLDNLALLNIPKTVLSDVFTPIQYGMYQMGLKVYDQFEILARFKTASQENKALHIQLSNLLVENSTLRKELSQAKAQLIQEQTLSPTTYNMVLSSPIGLSRYLILNKGTNDSIAPGEPVVYKDSLIGIVKDSTSNRSKVILTSDPDSKISAFASNSQGKTKGLLLGQYGQEMLLDKILHNEQIELGALVYTDGLEEHLPKGLVLGQVTEIISSDNQVFKQAKVRPLSRAEDLDVVFVITN